MAAAALYVLDMALSRLSRNLSPKPLPQQAMAYATSFSHYLGKSGGRFMAYISKPPSLSHPLLRPTVKS